MIITRVAIAISAPELPLSPAQIVDRRSPVNQLFSRTQFLSLRRQSCGCYHSASCLLIAARTSLDALFIISNFPGVLGRPSLTKWKGVDDMLVCVEVERWPAVVAGLQVPCVAACAMRHCENCDLPAFVVSTFSYASASNSSANTAAASDELWPYVHPDAMQGRRRGSPGNGMWERM
eukprot:6182645-Pleurochrysis_carterae.AAC.2